MKNPNSATRSLMLLGFFFLMNSCEKEDLAISPTGLCQPDQSLNSTALFTTVECKSQNEHKVRGTFDLKIDHLIYAKSNYVGYLHDDMEQASIKTNPAFAPKEMNKYIRIKAVGQGWSEIFGRNFLHLKMMYNPLTRECSGTMTISFPFDSSVISLMTIGDDNMILIKDMKDELDGLIVDVESYEATGVFKDCHVLAKARIADVEEILNVSGEIIEAELNLSGIIEMPG
jgi:hypothetical protein